MTPRKPLTAFRLDDELRERLERAAVEDDRPVSYVIRQAITEWLERREGVRKAERKRPASRRRS